MKNIKPITIWREGVTMEAVILSAYLSYDDLKTTATFYYSLRDTNLITIVDGKVDMSGADYTDWDDSNDGAYSYIAGKLNLIITGDYIEPAPVDNGNE
jgi:hypothetical protein